MLLSARFAKAVTPHDTNALSGGTCSALFCGGAGTVTVRADDDDADVLFTGVLAGQVLPMRCKYVRATGTTATNIVALYE